MVFKKSRKVREILQKEDEKRRIFEKRIHHKNGRLVESRGVNLSQDDDLNHFADMLEKEFKSQVPFGYLDSIKGYHENLTKLSYQVARDIKNFKRYAA